MINTPRPKPMRCDRGGGAAWSAPNMVQTDIKPAMGSEDFAFMLQKRPGAYICIGAGRSRQRSRRYINPYYDFNDAILPLGAAYWVELVEAATCLLCADAVRLRHLQDRHRPVEFAYGGADARGADSSCAALARDGLLSPHRAGARRSLRIAGRDRPRPCRPISA